MEGASRETANLAFDLFDRYGRIQRDYCHHDVKKGTGVWGEELDRGDLLLFEHIQVNQLWRRQGTASKIVNAIMEKTREKVAPRMRFFALVQPGFVTRKVEHSQETWEEHLEIAQSFWRALGFRSVGTSSWLAWTDSVEHPSRHLELGQDWEEAQEKSEDKVIPKNLKELCRKLTDPEADEEECIGEVQTVLCSDLNGRTSSVLDHRGNTLLHVTALCCQPDLVRSILAEAPQAATLRNIEGYTPAGALQKQLDDQRTRRTINDMFIVVSDEFTGYSASAVACMAAFQQLSAFDLSTLSHVEIETAVTATEDQICTATTSNILGVRRTLQLKYGCTCGECLGGFISPRMKLALLCVAKFQYDMVNDQIEQVSGPDWVLFNEHCFEHLPYSVRNNLKTNKAMRQGFTNIFNHFAECLRRGRIPSDREVLSVLETSKSEWPPVTKSFLQRGGSVASVATMIFKTAMDQDEWSGNGEHRSVFFEDINQLPSCRNDHEFGFVSGTCGYKRIRPDSSRLVDMFGPELKLE